jgi:predicted transcriptional regulator
MTMKLAVRNGRQAMVAVLIVSALLAAIVYVFSFPVTDPDGTIDPKESVVAPSPT